MKRRGQSTPPFNCQNPYLIFSDYTIQDNTAVPRIIAMIPCSRNPWSDMDSTNQSKTLSYRLFGLVKINTPLTTPKIPINLMNHALRLAVAANKSKIPATAGKTARIL